MIPSSSSSSASLFIDADGNVQQSFFSRMLSVADRVGVPIFRVMMKAMGLFLVTLALGLIGGVALFWFYVILPLLTVDYSFGRYFHIVLAIIVLFEVLFNYFMVVRTNPGNPPVEWTQAMEKHIDTLRTDTADPRKGEGFSMWCKRCNKAKPPRAHHCFICNRCIARMDHHCPWMNNCVGYQNHRYFILFLNWVWFGAMYVFVALVLGFFGIIKWDTSILHQWYAIILFTGMLCFSMSLAMAGFSTFHIYLVLSNQTTIEFQNNKIAMLRGRSKGEVYMNEYDIGPLHNLELVFGTTAWWFWFWPLLKPLPYDGVYYPSLKNAERKLPHLIV